MHPKDEVVEALDKIAKERHSECDHGVSFDSDKSQNLSVAELRKAYPRLMGLCPKGCGYNGIAYASFKHYIMGDW